MELELIERNDAITLVALRGRLDVAGLHAVDVKFHGHTAAQKKPTIVDLSGLEFIASLGMGMLMGCARSLHNAGVRMALLSPQPLVDEALRTAGFDQAIPIATELAEAERIVSEPAA